MKYTGLLYGKIGRKYVPMEHDTQYYDEIEDKIKQLKKACERFYEIWGNDGKVDETDISFLLDAVEDLVLRSKQ